MRTLVHRVALAAIVLAALIIPLAKMDSRPARADVPLPRPIEGTSSQCEDFAISIFGPLFDVLLSGVLAPFGITAPELKADVPDEGWVWVNRSDRYREVEGVVERSKTAAIDFPATHDTHDQNTIIKVDPKYTGVLGRVNEPNEEKEEIDPADLLPPTDIEMEWEHGTRNFETGRGEPERFFPRWAWPAVGDRVWTEGNWVFDCGHATKVDGVDHFRSEIHPARAIAAMRQQVHELPGSGTTQVPVTATDLYIHGRAGIITDILEYGQTIVQTPTLDVVHDINDHLVTPIDNDFDFEVCLPPQPSPSAVPAFSFEDGPGNTISIPPELELAVADSTGPCAITGSKELHVRVPLAGTGVSGDEVYARKIYTGWVYPAASLRHFVVKLDRMDLHTDKEVEGSLGGDCECTFFYVNLDKAPDEWSRLADHWVETCNIYIPNPFGDDICIDHNTLNDYDSDELLGNGLLNFSGPTYDFLVQDGKPFHIRSSGYDQDCADDLFDIPLLYHFWNAINYATCYYLSAAVTFEKGRNDDFARLDVCFVESDESLCNEGSTEHITGYGVGTHDFSADGEYEMRFTVSEEPVVEDTADLATTKSCSHDGEVALAGAPFTCTVTVTNASPGLPTGALLSDTFTTALAGSTYALGTPTFTTTLGTETTAPQSCAVTPPNAFSCAIGTVPVGGSVTATVTVTPSQPGTFNNSASVTATTTDPNTANNSSSAVVRVFLPVQIDIKPGGVPNSISLTPGGLASVAILRTNTFNPATVSFASVCFGDVDAPLERDCTEKHGMAHMQDVDKDKDIDMLLHYEVEQTGIDLTDTRACLIGNTTAGIGIFGCDSVRPLK